MIRDMCSKCGEQTADIRNRDGDLVCLECWVTGEPLDPERTLERETNAIVDLYEGDEI